MHALRLLLRLCGALPRTLVVEVDRRALLRGLEPRRVVQGGCELEVLRQRWIKPSGRITYREALELLLGANLSVLVDNDLLLYQVSQVESASLW